MRGPCVFSCLLLLTLLPAQGGAAPLAGRLHPQQGDVTILDGGVTLSLPQDLGYLTPKDTNIMLHKTMGFKGQVNSFGALVPATVPVGSPAFWSALITYRADGHVVVDDKTPPIDADALLIQIAKDNKAYNDMLRQKGYGRLMASVLDWAEKPVYDPEVHALYWALDTKPVDSEAHVINYHIAFLGKQGVLSLFTAAPLEQLPMLVEARKKMLAAVQFNAPYRYTDFDPLVQKKAHYGIADIITGHNAAAAASGEKQAMKIAFTLMRFALFLALIYFVLRLFRRKKA